MMIKVHFDFYRYANIEVEARIDGLAINHGNIELVYIATIVDVWATWNIPDKQIEFESLKICQVFSTIEECLQNAVVELRERVK